MQKITEKEMKELITKHGLRLGYNYDSGEAKEVVYVGDSEDLPVEYLKANIEAIKGYLNKLKKEEKEYEKNNVTFYATGMETHKVTVNKNDNLKERFTEIADRYQFAGYTVDSLMQDFLEEIKETEEDAKNEIESLETFIKENEEKDLMTDAEREVWKKNYINVNNEGTEGYIPNRVTKEDIIRAKEKLEKIRKEKRNERKTFENDN